MSFSGISNVVYPVGRVAPNVVNLLGTAFLIGRPGRFITAAHVTNQDDTNLVIVTPRVASLTEYQDTTNNQVQILPARITAIDPFRDLCVLSVDSDIRSNLTIAGTDGLATGEDVAIFGFPHADQGRMVLTHQVTEIGAKILIDAGGLKSKHVVLNIQARPGQSGSPVLRHNDRSVVAVLIGSYAPGGGGGISLGGIG